LVTLDHNKRNQAIQGMATALRENFVSILEENTLDLEYSREMAVSELVLDWLKLNPKRLEVAINALQRLVKLPDPLEQLCRAEQKSTSGLVYEQPQPLGVVAFIYEGFPELAAIAAGLAIKTGNSLILRGGSEGTHSHRTIAQTLQLALKQTGLPENSLLYLPGDRPFNELVTSAEVNLAIPYGRPSLVKQVCEQATIPVLPTSMGNCYLYWSTAVSWETVRSILVDSHKSEPDAVNAIEKVLIHQEQKNSALLLLWHSLQEKGFQLRGDAELATQFPQELTLAKEGEWSHPYLNKTIAFRVVDSTEGAIAYINQHSSGHGDCLVTDSYSESRQFARNITSASLFINTSSRFDRCPEQRQEVFLGMSRHRGLIGLKSFTTTKQIIQGN
jgi:glutamate-5-semialdehyde dehydrogenase